MKKKMKFNTNQLITQIITNNKAIGQAIKHSPLGTLLIKDSYFKINNLIWNPVSKIKSLNKNKNNYRLLKLLRLKS